MQSDAFPGSRPYGASERDLLQAVRDLVQADRDMRTVVSRRMALGERDMRALRFVMAAAGRGQGASPHDLARHLAISTAATTVLLDRLVHGRYVERVAHPTDGRGKVIVPTAYAFEETRTELRGAHDRMREVAAAVPAASRPAVLTFLRDLTEVMREQSAPD